MLVKAFNVISIPQAGSFVQVNAFGVIPISCAAIARTNDSAGQELGREKHQHFLFKCPSITWGRGPPAQHRLGQGTACSASPGAGNTGSASPGQGQEKDFF